MASRKSNFYKVVTITLVIAIIAAVVCIGYLVKHRHKTSSMGEYNDLYLAGNLPSYAMAVKRSAPAVVSIQTSKAGTQHQGLGSGVIVDNNGHILTNNHVIQASAQINVTLADGRQASAAIVGIDAETDLAVLQIQLADLPVVKIGKSAKLQVGDVVLAIGNPYGLSSSVTQGIVSAIGSIHNMSTAQHEFGELLDNLIQTDAAINLGNSGGALIDAYGNLIGINTAVVSNATGSQGIGFAIPVDTAKHVLAQIIDHGSVTRGWLGAQLTELPKETRRLLQYQDPNGIYVQDTIRNSPAQKAGILPGDIITKVNDIEAKNIFKTIRLISSLQPQKSYNLEIFRGGERLVYAVKISTRP